MQFMTLFIHLGYDVKILIRARVLENTHTHKKDSIKMLMQNILEMKSPNLVKIV